MRLRTLFLATPLLFAAAANGQLPPRTPDFRANHDSRIAIPTFVGPVKQLSTPLATMPVQIIKLTPNQYRIARNNTCYATRSYDYTADQDGSGRVTPQGTTTCQPAGKSHLKSAAGQ